jgi:2-polyprenyl-6-methoxyphenol hydroxylase-like FAD-dependent oxidoreductase
VLDEPARALETMIRLLQRQPAGQDVAQGHIEKEDPRVIHAFGRAGSDLLSRVLRRSTIGAEGFNGRVRNGIGFSPLAKTTGPAKYMNVILVLSNAARQPPLQAAIGVDID